MSMMTWCIIPDELMMHKEMCVLRILVMQRKHTHTPVLYQRNISISDSEVAFRGLIRVEIVPWKYIAKPSEKAAPMACAHHPSNFSFIDIPHSVTD